MDLQSGVSDDGLAVDVPEWAHAKLKEQTQNEMEYLELQSGAGAGKYANAALKKRHGAHERWGMYGFPRHRVRELPDG